jgi:hypothetical protein
MFGVKHVKLSSQAGRPKSCRNQTLSMACPRLGKFWRTVRSSYASRAAGVNPGAAISALLYQEKLVSVFAGSQQDGLLQ